MGFYIRKSFRAGPIRFNLSKSGIGVSGGVKGARIGIGPRGTYVHAGRQGLYYRKNLSHCKQTTNTNNRGCLLFVLALIAISLGIPVINWLAKNSIFLIAGIIMALFCIAIRWKINIHRKKLLTNYQQGLDTAFITSKTQLTPAIIAKLKLQRQDLPKDHASEKARNDIEENVYSAILDKVLDAGFITKEESACIATAEQLMQLNSATCLRNKKEIFSSAYLEAIQDHAITKQEIDKLANILVGLAIPKTAVQQELDIIKDIVESQKLRLPLPTIPTDTLHVPIQKSEDIFDRCAAQVLSKRKSKESPSGYEYTVKRDGILVLTNKRLFVSGGGMTNIRYSEIADLDVDIDEGILEISKIGSGRPIVIKTGRPFYMGRKIDLLMSVHATA